MRIEDVVVITAEGAEVLSRDAPVAVDDIEALAGSRAGCLEPVFPE